MNPYDEFWEQPGSPRPHQKALWEQIQRMDVSHANTAEIAVAARVREQEISFNLLGDPDGTTRPWRLDPMPLLMDESEFTTLAAGMAERASLLAEVLDDIYGPQKLITDGLLPAELVYGNPRYFRSVVGLTPLGPSHLSLYAADLGRNEAGVFEVYSDRTAAPTGSGYALENRLAIGQVHSEWFREYRVRKINRFFSVVQDCLRLHAPEAGRAPRMVLLTPGVQDESSFEHAYLARYLGLELVEGRDLTVRGEEVFLKTLEGLKKVDVILRRVVDDWCDPLELREDSILGVSGLVSAARAGSVAIVNALGSGVVEAPAFKAYLGNICQALRGKSLILPSTPCRWLGDKTQREEVLSSLDQWVFKHAFNERSGPALVGATLDQGARENLRRRILETPGRWVAERWGQRSICPSGIAPMRMHPMAVRFFACRADGDYQVMPGGLVRLDGAPDGLFISKDEASLTKDLWIPAEDAPEAPRLPTMPVEQLVLKRGGIDLPSRLFDDIFWLGRYIERCDNTTRLVRSGLEPLAGESADVPEELSRAITRVVLALKVVNPPAGKVPGLQKLLLTALYDDTRPNTVISGLARIRALTTAVRSRLSRDTWGALRRTGNVLSHPPNGPPRVEDALSELQELVFLLAAIHGFLSSNMVRGHAWMFVEMGRRIERGVFVLTLLAQVFPKDESHLMMETLLTICDSTLTYRSRYLSTLQPAPVADLLLTDMSNPASVLFQVRRLLECVRQLPGEPRFPLSRAEQRLVNLEAKLITSDVIKACEEGAESLRALAEESINLLWQVSDDLAQTYFNHAGLAHAVHPSKWIDDDLEAI